MKDTPGHPADQPYDAGAVTASRGPFGRAPVILDGGLSTVLEELGCDLNHPLWTARLLRDDPAMLLRAHLAYLRAGASVLTTASYQASLASLGGLGLSKAEAARTIRRSVDLAREAVRRFERENSDTQACFVAASIGPFGASLADGSEYRGDYRISDPALVDFHSGRLQALETSDADCYAVETIPSLREARIIAALLEKCSKPAWISFSCRDGLHISDGTPISECARALRDHPAVFAIGVNCTAPRHVGSLIAALKAAAGTRQIIVYPNSGEAYDPVRKRWRATGVTESFEEQALAWIGAGATIVGGCCRVGPGQIAALASALAGATPPG